MQGKNKSLVETITLIKKRIKAVSDKQISEEDTKFKLINPVLEALGWDLQDYDEVVTEYRSESHHNPVDYAFFLQENPVLFLEAKALSRDLDDAKWIGQTLKYAFEADVDWCVLGNGREYKIYRTHAKGKLREKLFKTINLTEAENLGDIEYFLGLISKASLASDRLSAQWKTSFVDQRVKAALESMVSTPDEALVRLLVKRTDSLSTAEIRQSLGRAKHRVEFKYDSNVQIEVTPAKSSKRIKQSKPKASGINVAVRHLIVAGLINPPLTLERVYKGHTLIANILPTGEVQFDGMNYHSLSIAAGMARATVIGPRSATKRYHSTNGWTFWKYRNPATGKLELIDELRKQYLASQQKLEVI